LRTQIEEALNIYKKRTESIEGLERALTEARQSEALYLKQSLTDDDPRLVRKIAESRTAIEVDSRRSTFSQQSLSGSLADVVALMRQLQAQLVQQLVTLKAQRTRTHYEVLVKELDQEAVDWFGARNGLGTDLLGTLAGFGRDVRELDRKFPYLSWVRDGSAELTLKRVETDMELLFAAVQKFQTEVLEQIEG